MRKILSPSEERYRSIIEDQPDVIRRFLPDGTFTFVNDAYCRFFLRQKDSIIGSNMFSLVSEEVENSIRESLAVLTLENPVNTYERLVKLRNGEVRWVQWVERAIFDEDGNVLEYQSTGRDITGLKKIEQELSRLNKELAALNTISDTLIESRDFNQMLDAALGKTLEVMELDGGSIYILEEKDNSQSLVQVAQRGLHNHSSDYPLEITLDQGSILSDPCSPSHNLAAIVNAFQRGFFARDLISQPFLFSTALQGRDQAMGVLSVYCTDRNISSQQEEVLTMIARQIGVTVENIQLVKKNSEIAVMQEVNRIRSELIANVSHEMKTPLGLIMIMVTTLLREEVKINPEMVQTLLKDISSETYKLNEIVDNLLSVSSIETRKERLQKKSCTIQRLAKRVIQSLAVQAMDHSVLVDFPNQPIIVKADERQIEQVFRNLIVNAIKYSPTESAITVSGSQFENDVLIQVKDEGIGIPAADIKHIFERFYRADNELVKSSPGVGLGLSICKEIVEAHNGKIWVESKSEEGSSFFFSLPVK